MRKRRRRKIHLRRIAIFAVIVIAIFAVMSLNNLLVHWQFPTLVSNFFQGFGGPAFPIRVPTGAMRDVRALGGDIAVLTDANLHVFNRNGRQLLSVHRVNESTIMLANGNRMLTYTIGSPDFSVYFRNRLVHDGHHGDPIRTAALGERGNYAIVSSTWRFTSQVTVFDEDFEQKIEWNTSEWVAMVALSPRGNQMSAAVIDAQGGQLRSTVLLFDFEEGSQPVQLEFFDEFILGLEYLSDTHIVAITDRGLRIISAGEGRLLNSYDIRAGQIAMSRMSGGYILLLNENPEYRTQTVILFNTRGDELGRASPQNLVRDMQVGSAGVYILTAQGVARYDHTMQRTGETEQSGIMRILLAANNLYYFTNEEINVMRIDAVQTDD